MDILLVDGKIKGESNKLSSLFLIMIKLVILMFICHVIDDFVFQPICLSKLKQKKFWLENTNNQLYKNDYKMALVIHSFSWSGMILLPWIIFAKDWIIMIMFFINGIIHCIVDDAKANKLTINLIQDQFIHICQIILTFIILWVTL